jgi:hypothetical protein
MKKLIITSVFLLSMVLVFAQSEKYVKTMEARIAAMDTIRQSDGFVELANAFERIGDAEKNQWLPYYYAAFSALQAGYTINGAQMGGNADKLDPLTDKAEALLNKADALSKNNSEIYVMRKMIASLRMLGDPMNRYMQYGPIASEALAVAQKLNPDNPRIYLMMGQDKFYTPEQFGGSKAEAKKLFELALQKFETFKPESSLSPNWGKNMTQYFLSQN